MLRRLFIVILLPFLFCSCSQKHGEEITFSYWGSITEVPVTEKIIKNFETENPEIKINKIHIPQNYFQKIHLLFASNQSPDVVFINNLYLPVYAQNLLPVDNIINKEDFYQESLNAMSYDGKLLAVPRDISTLVFYRNKKLIRSNMNNLDDLTKAVKNVKPYGIGCERDIYYMLPYVLTFNETIESPDKSLKFYRNLEKNYAPAPSEIGSSTLAQMFMSGKLGLYLSGRWMYPKITEKANFDWDVITFPGIVPLDASGWAITRSSKHKDAAIKLVKYLASEKSIEQYSSTGLIVPARRDVKIDNPVFIDAISKSKAMKINKNYRKKADRMNKELFN